MSNPRLELNHDEAKGTIELREGTYGATLLINGREAVYIDLAPCVGGEPAQLIIDNPLTDDEPFAKLVLDNGGPTLYVHPGSQKSGFGAEVRNRGIHHGMLDHTFRPEGTHDS